MASGNQKSKFCYVPQPYFLAGDCTVDAETSVTIENSDGIFSPDLSNLTTLKVLNNAVTLNVSFDKNDSNLVDQNMTVGLIGCALFTYETDTNDDPILNTKTPEPFYVILNPSNMLDNEVTNHRSFSSAVTKSDIVTFCESPLPGVIGGGVANVIFSELGPPSGNDGTAILQFSIIRADPTTNAIRPYMEVQIGHLFIGVELDIQQNPQSFQWGVKCQNQSFIARDFGAIKSTGVIRRQASGEIIKIGQDDIMGSRVDGFSMGGDPNDITYLSNFFSLVQINNSYPMIFNPYPQAGYTTSFPPTTEEFNLLARQNFFSIYGFLDGPMEFQPSEFRDGLKTQYRAKFRITETR